MSPMMPHHKCDCPPGLERHQWDARRTPNVGAKASPAVSTSTSSAIGRLGVRLSSLLRKGRALFGRFWSACIAGGETGGLIRAPWANGDGPRQDGRDDPFGWALDNWKGIGFTMLLTTGVTIGMIGRCG